MVLTSFFLSFKDRETQAIFQNKRRSFHAKTMPIILITQIILSVGLFLAGIKTRAYKSNLDKTVNQFNMIAILLFAVLSVLVRYSYIVCWFVSPAITCVSFYYFAWIDYEPENVSNVFTVFIAMSFSYFVTIVFNEVWLISTAVYLPLLSFYMAKLGDGFIADSTDNTELIQRVFICTILYAIVSYINERDNKKSFVGQVTENLLFKRWL